MKPLKLFYVLYLISVFYMIISCSGGPETKVSVSLSHKFPEIRISGPEGNIISLVAEDDSTGSIGFVSSGEVT